MIPLLQEIRACKLCEVDLPLGANPVLDFTPKAKLLVVGQAPGTRVHATGIPWNDPSGDRLREWMGLDKPSFYDATKIAIVPMGFCYPGKGKSGDLPPRPECAKMWREKIHTSLPEIALTLLIGQYAQQYYLGQDQLTLTQRVAQWRDYLPKYLPLPHPSPRNNIWLRKNPWFDEVVLTLKQQVARVLS
ncbi:MAG: uracil-DNA glycosylase family protein [Pseudomonadales bacterium]|nr:uracil-DNA glycosylase family protein [Pseudomonadales bacterium]